ncbi:MAG: ribosome maturation factor RimM [Mycobacteriales bacterium]
MHLVVGRVGRAHGVKGAVLVRIHTDDPDERFAPGSVVATEPAQRGPLTVRSMREHHGSLVVEFAGITDRAAAEALRGTSLVIDTAALPELTGADDFYDHQLVGVTAVLTNGSTLGTVTEISHSLAGDLLVIRRAGAADRSADVLVPFVHAIVPEVDIGAGRLVVDPPPGLLEL